MAINVLEVIRQGQVGGGESHLLDLIAGFDNRVNPIVLSFTGGQMIDALTQRGVKCHVVNTSHPFDVRITRQIKELILREHTTDPCPRKSCRIQCRFYSPEATHPHGIYRSRVEFSPRPVVFHQTSPGME